MPVGSLKELKRAYLDVNFYNLAEIRALSRKFGKISAMCLTQIYLAMSAAEDARIDEDAILDILENAEIENIADFIPYCLEKSLIKLFREKIADESQKTTIISESKIGLPDSDYDTDLNISLKELDTPDIRTWLYLAMKRINASGGVTDEIWIESQLLKYAGRPDDLLAALKHTASLTKTRNLYDPTTQARGSPQKKSTQETIKELMAKEQAKKDGTRSGFENNGDYSERISGSLPGNSGEARRLGRGFEND